MRDKYILAILLLFSIQFAAYAQKPIIIGYYAAPLNSLDQYDISKLDQIIFCFAHLNGNQFHIGNEEDSLIIKKMVSYKKKYPNLKVLMSLGGWGGCATCSPVFATDIGRKEFAQSVLDHIQYFQADGIDLDWEYPAVSGYPGHPYHYDDRNNFTQLVKVLRKTLGKTRVISFATGGSTVCIDSSYDWRKVMKYVQYVNLMSYDLIHGYSKTSGHHTALYGNDVQLESTDNGVRKLIQYGVPRKKIIIGAATYGRVFTVANTINNGLNRGAYFSSSISSKNINDSLAPHGPFIPHYDSVSQAPFALDIINKRFLTYDDKISIGEKMNYLKRMKLGGIMFWQLIDDRPRDGLLEIMYRNK